MEKRMTISYGIASLAPYYRDSLSGLKVFYCGGVQVLLMTPKVKLSEEMFKTSLHENELSRAQHMGSSTRRQEYLRSRYFMHCLFESNDEIISDPAGFIIWPAGLRGSLTHKDNLIALSLVPDSPSWGQGGLGLDIEGSQRVHRGLESKILQQNEAKLVTDFVEKNRNSIWTYEKILAVVFSFKESIFKAIYPLGRRFFYFDKFEVLSCDLNLGKISGILKFDASEMTPTGFLVEGSFVLLTDDDQEWVVTTVILDEKK
jgi:4'-phosphopantetheinyl transferase EntD